VFVFGNYFSGKSTDAGKYSHRQAEFFIAQQVSLITSYLASWHIGFVSIFTAVLWYCIFVYKK